MIWRWTSTRKQVQHVRGTRSLSQCALDCSQVQIAEALWDVAPQSFRLVGEVVGSATAAALAVVPVLLARKWRRGTRSGRVATFLAPVVGNWQADAIAVMPFPGASCGAEILGIDLRESIMPQTAWRLRQELRTHGVLLVRGQTLRAVDALRAAEVFGEPVPAPKQKHGIAFYRVKDRDREQQGSDFWHSDNSYMELPGGPTILYALKVPKDDNGRAMGDTLFIDAGAAAKRLPQALRRRVEGVNAVHQNSHNNGVPLPKRYFDSGQWRALPDAIHPVLRRNPLTDHETLFLGPSYVRELVGMSAEESKGLLESLYQHLLQPSEILCHQWQEGDLLVWDNGRMLHKATTLKMPPEVERLMYRVMTKGPGIRDVDFQECSDKHGRH